MKLTEITASRIMFDSYDDESIATAQSYMNKTVDKTVSLEGGRYELKITSDNYFALFKGENLIGWTMLVPEHVKGKRYYSLHIVYLIPASRKTRALLIMINAIRRELNAPIIIDGNVFKDGEQTLRALSKRETFKVNIMDLKTGKMSSFDGVVPNDKRLAVVIEELRPLTTDVHFD